MDRKKAEEIANFRFSLISPIVCKESLYFGETAELIRGAAVKIYQIPGNRKTRVSIRTIERYLKQYREGGFKALMPKYTNPRSTRIPPEYFELALALKRENLKRSINQIIEILHILEDRGHTVSRNVPINSDNPKRKIKLYLIAWLEEASRIIPHGQLYPEEKSYTLEDCLKKAMLKYGLPEQIYVDNGKVYSSNQLQSICGRLGIHLSHTRPYKPQGRGKLERVFATIRRSFLPEIEVMLKEKVMSIDEINDYFFIWLRQHYHEKVHSATKQKPMLAFESDTYPLRRVDLATMVFMLI